MINFLHLEEVNFNIFKVSDSNKEILQVLLRKKSTSAYTLCIILAHYILPI